MANYTIRTPNDPIIDEPDGGSHSKLCNKCSVLSFNDAELGGYEEDGVLQFDDVENDQRKTLRIDYNHSDTLPYLPLLQESARSGCHFCATLRKETLSLGIDHSGDITYTLHYTFGPKLTERYEEEVGIYLLIVEMSIIGEDLEILREGLVFTVDSTGACRDWLQTLPSPSGDALCTANMTDLINVLSGCDTNCECSEAEASDFLPTRLLDLHDWGTSKLIRVVEASSIAPSTEARYVALSYCWGPPSAATLQLKTTHETYQERLIGINADSLTPVMKDAVDFTHALSFRYLWIDALCIIQGDYEDWVRESAQMDLVYANAYFALCPLTSSTCLQGFLKRERSIQVPFKSSIQDETTGTIHLRFLKSGLIGNMFSINYMETAATVWNTRGWTFQEKNLASRRIYVGRSQLHYMCARKEWMEPSWWSTSPEDHQIQQYLMDDDRYGDPNDNWTELVDEYVSRQLTNPADRFPALSGIAKLFAKATGDDYVAGLWSSDILRQCLWKGYRGVNSLEKLLESLSVNNSDDYICPSWSWARQHNVIFPHFKAKHAFRSECKSLKVWAVPTDTDLNPWGCVRDGHLEVEARYLTIDGVWTRITARTSASNFHVWTVRLGSDCRVDCSLDWDDSNVDFVPFKQAIFVLLASSMDTEAQVTTPETVRESNLAWDGLEVRVSKQEATLSVDAGISCANIPFMTRRKAWGLLLRPSRSGHIVRIGLFEIRARFGGPGIFRDSPLRVFDIVECKAAQ
ncbi:HET-domain-containing protein [Didymella exigua CBS 183.55]|uniref:HET-domain-containing protein n=1 Tax=Didymella exigua CBS 183.55 TaxID=1150837 RepID=A0A6A5RGZ2_9PLEO|nr:HET-domain-containing protein [Didymella exigua CBS 183.55]KAF1926799.1 HET-domain-containing protein [Didymella exigua CBS 183.55]